MDNPTPPRGTSSRQRLSNVLGGPAGLRRRDFVLFGGLGVLGLVLVAAVVVVPRLLADSGPDWPAPQTLPTAKPVWTDDIGGDDRVLMHEDVLVRAKDTREGDVVTVNELSTGDELFATGDDVASSHLSQDTLITVAADADEAVVRDLHSGEAVRTIEISKYAFVTVASGMLVSVEQDGETKSRMRGIDVSTGKEKWTAEVDASWWDLGLESPGAEPNRGPFSEAGLSAESTSTVFFLRYKDETAAGMWEEIEAFDVTTGALRWDTSVSYSGDGEPEDLGFELLDNGDVFTQVAYDTGSESVTSHVIDAETGEVDDYDGTTEESTTATSRMLHGNRVLTTTAGKSALVDVTNGKTVWKSDEEGSLVNGGDVVFRSVTARNNGAANVERMFMSGMRAYDTDTGKTLWTKQGNYGGIDVVGDEMITTAFAKAKGDVEPIQVFDWRTGKGKWQLAGEMVAHNDDYFAFMDKDAEYGPQLSIVSRENPR